MPGLLLCFLRQSVASLEGENPMRSESAPSSLYEALQRTHKASTLIEPSMKNQRLRKNKKDLWPDQEARRKGPETYRKINN